MCHYRKAVRMGQHVWLLLATIATEMLVIIKWSQGQFPAPLPKYIKWSWMIGGALLVLYPIIRVCRIIVRYFQKLTDSDIVLFLVWNPECKKIY